MPFKIDPDKVLTKERKAEREAARAAADARAYLATTDWMMLRDMETRGTPDHKPIPANVAALRAKARRIASGEKENGNG